MYTYCTYVYMYLKILPTKVNLSDFALIFKISNSVSFEKCEWIFKIFANSQSLPLVANTAVILPSHEFFIVKV